MSLDTEIRRFRGFGDTNYVSWGNGHGASGLAGAPPAPLPEVVYTFDSLGAGDVRWRVKSFHATEGLSTLYAVTLELATEALHASPDMLLGHPAVLQLYRDPMVRRFYGLARRVEQLGATRHERLARVHLVPRLWVLSQRTNTRSFQDMSAPQVVVAVLRDAALYEGHLVLELRGTYPPRELCVQYRETDLAFVQRLLEEEGITFLFRHDTDAETLVLTDGDGGWRPLATSDGGAVPIVGPEQATLSVESVRALRWEQELRPTGVEVRDFDFTRPEWTLSQRSPRAGAGDRSHYEPSPTITLGGYEGVTYRLDNAAAQAERRAEAESAPSALGAGEGVVTTMVPGATFAVTLAGVELEARRYVLIEVVHQGEASEELLMPTELQGAASRDRYSNRFRCALAESPWRPARVTPRPEIAGLLSATVVGPAHEEIHTDAHGRIQVRFHWDRLRAGGGASTCWVRAIQGPWSGNGWGFQFVPRVGMEVAVSFLDGNPDRPVITGALYNGRNRPPFALPQEKTRSGVRSSSSPGGVGHNELSFEDLAGGEEIYVHAQRDMNEVVERDHTLRVGHDEVIAVSGHQTQTVGGWQRETVVGDQALTVESNRHETVRVNRAVHVHGDQTHRVEGNDTVTVNGNADRFYVHDVTTRVGGRARSEVAGASDESVSEDHTVRVKGHSVTIVGKYEAKRSSVLHVEGTASFYSSQTMELESEKDVLLRCGRSMIRLTPQRIELVSPEVIVRGGENRVTVGGERVKVRAKSEVVIGGEKVTVKSSGAAVKLEGDATVMGGAVKLGPGSIPLDSDPNDPARVTTIELKDQEGHPIPYQRFVVVMADGSEQSGFVNHEGKVTVELEEDAEVVWPELNEVQLGHG